MPHFFLLLFFSCSCKIPWTGKKCENKNGKINLFFFFKWKRSGHCNQEDFTAISDKSVVLNLEVHLYRPLIWQFGITLVNGQFNKPIHSKVVD